MRSIILLVGLAACGGSSSALSATDSGSSGSDSGVESGHANDAGGVVDATLDGGGVDSGEDALAMATTWRVAYNASTDAGTTVGTAFQRVDGGAVGVYSGTCYANAQIANVAAVGSDFTITPQTGCVEQGGPPCVFCGPPGNCPSGTAVALTHVADAGLTWQGSCGAYAVTLVGE